MPSGIFDFKHIARRRRELAGKGVSGRTFDSEGKLKPTVTIDQAITWLRDAMINAIADAFQMPAKYLRGPTHKDLDTWAKIYGAPANLSNEETRAWFRRYYDGAAVYEPAWNPTRIKTYNDFFELPLEQRALCYNHRGGDTCEHTIVLDAGIKPLVCMVCYEPLEMDGTTYTRLNTL